MSVSNVARCLVVTIGISLVLPVAAQGLEEIVVTARKREESLQKIPITISVFNEEALDRYHITDLKSVADYTPGLTFDQGFVQQDTRPQIRGLPATRGRPPVAILLDGIDISSESMVTAGGGMLANLALVDAERIEVVKGPQSALYGRVAFGGAVNYVTKVPSESFEASVTVDAGDNGQLELKAGIGGPLSDTFGVRFNIAHASHDGFYQDSTSGTDVGTSESTGFSLVGQFTPNDRFDVSSRVMFSESEWSPRAQYALLTGTNSSVVFPMPANLIGLVIGGNPLPSSVLVPRLGDIEALDEVQLSLDPRTGQAFKGATLDSFIWHTVANFQLTDKVTLTSWTGYTDAESAQNQDTDFFGLPFEPVSLPLPGGTNEPLNVFNQSDLRTETRQLSQEFRLSNLDSDDRLRWAVGYQYWREDVAQQNRNIISVLFGVPGFAASAGLNLSLAPEPPYQNEFRDTEHQSVYGLMEYDFSDRLTGSFEARYSDEDFDQAWLVGGISAFGFVPPFGPPAALSIGVTDSATTSDDFFTPRATLEFQYDDDTLYYGTISKGAKPGGVSSIFGTNSQTGRFFPETLWNYELGVKTALADGQLLLNAAVFFMDYTDRQINTLEPSALSPTGFALFTRNQGEAEVLGLEMDATWLVSENWTITGAYTHLDTEVTDGRSSTTGALTIATGGNCTVVTGAGGATSCIVDTTGQQLERIPENELIISSIYRTPINTSMDFGFDLTVRYQDDRSIAGANLHIFPSFTLVDARLGIETDRWDAYLYADNLFDDDTIKSGQSYGDLQALGNLAITAFAPDQRQIGVRINHHFGN